MEGEKKMRKQWRKRAAAFCLAAAVAVSCLPASVPVLAAESEGTPDRLEVLGGEETGTAASAEVQNGAFSGGFEQRPDTANLTKQGTIIPAVDFDNIQEVLVITQLKQQTEE